MINWLLPLRQTDATAEPSITQQAGAAERAVDANHGVLAAWAAAAGKRPGRGSEGKANADANGKSRSALMIISRGWPGMSPWRHGRSVHPHRCGRLAQPVLVSDWRQSRRNYRHRTSRAGQSSFAMEKSRCQTNGGTGEGCGWQETGRWIFYGLL